MTWAMEILWLNILMSANKQSVCSDCPALLETITPGMLGLFPRPTIQSALKLHSPMTFEPLHYFEINISDRSLYDTINQSGLMWM